MFFFATAVAGRAWNYLQEELIVCSFLAAFYFDLTAVRMIKTQLQLQINIRDVVGSFKVMIHLRNYLFFI